MTDPEIDPVCGMEVEVAPQALKINYRGRTYYFCSPGCQRSFEREPKKYLRDDSHTDQGQGE